jgi:hypothetical protein
LDDTPAFDVDRIFFGWAAPTRQMPTNYHGSIPFAVTWALVLVFSLIRFKKRGLWLLLGAPMALYWPIWLLFNQLPLCHHSRSCM